MPKNESVEFFLRFLRERFDVFRESLTEFLRAISQEDLQKKIARAKQVQTALDDLKRAIAANDRPSWIQSLEEKFSYYVKVAPQGQPQAGAVILQSILSVHRDIERQKWSFTDDSINSGIDFSAVYQEFYNASRVPELFDELVLQLEQIIQSGEVDSVQTLKALEKLVATIKKNARGDLFSTKGAWEFTQVFFKNVAVEVIESVPGLKQLVKGLRKTMSELDLEMSQVHDRIRGRLAETAKAELPMLQYKPLSLPAPKGETQEDS